MFEGVVNRHLAERAARRSVYSLGATAFETLMITGMVVITARLAAQPKEPPLVEVQFIRSIPRPPPPPAAAPAAAARPAAARRAATPSASPTVTARPRAPLALVQPREISDEMKPADPAEPLEDYGDGVDGVEGGVIGGIPGYVPDAAGAGGVTGVVARAADVIEEAPQYATSGFRPPQEATAGCVRGAIRLPAALTGYISAPVVVKFAVTRSGAIGAFQVMSPISDPRIAGVIRQALLSCRWVPGTDAQGRATSLWVVMPFRFEAG
jgi:protein TonB